MTYTCELCEFHSCPVEHAQPLRFPGLLDIHLRPLVVKQQSYLRDTTDFVMFIEDLNSQGPLPTGSLLVTADVTALYTNIPHKDGLESCQKALDKRSNQSPPTRDLIQLLELVLTLNNFTFKDTYYIQVSGTAWGTSSSLIRQIIHGWSGERFVGLCSVQNTLLKRFIDDIFFFIWTDSEENLMRFKRHLNNFHPTIKFTMDFSYLKRSLSRTLVEIKNNRLSIQRYTKPIDAHLL